MNEASRRVLLRRTTREPNLVLENLRGSEPVVLICAFCDHTVTEGIAPEKIPGAVVKCPHCGTPNEVDPAG